MNAPPPTRNHLRVRARGNIAACRAMESGPFERLLLADWKSLAFLHFEVDPDLLQPGIPFELDLHDGRCFASLVAFRMERMRFRRGGRATRWMTAPIANHHFLNLRVYVKGSAGPGIFFVREWLDNRLAVALGPALFGLPYRIADVEYDHAGKTKRGRIANGQGSVEYTGQVATEQREALDEFLLERYTAYCAEWLPRFFRVWHRPWEFRSLENVEIRSDSLLADACPEWWPSARFAGGHFSEGVDDVWMGRPHVA